MIFNVGLLILTFLLLTACGHDPFKESALINQGGSLTSLQLINSENFHQVQNSAALSGLDKEKELKIQEYCKGPEKVPEMAFVPLLFLIGPAIDFVLDQIDEALQEELKKYIAAYSGSVEEKFYKSTASGEPVANWTCFRFTRGVGPKGQEKIAMDLIGQLVLTKEIDGIKVRPLRLYFKEAKAKGEKIGISISLKSESVWRQNNRGFSEKSFEYEFLSEKIDFSNEKAVVKYYLDKDFDNYPRLPIIPWSTNREGDIPAGDTMLTVTVAEVGAPPKILEKAAKLFAKNKGDLAKLMKDSAKKLIPENN